jgi:hypothetical protein
MGALRDDSRELAHRDLQTTRDLGALRRSSGVQAT